MGPSGGGRVLRVGNHGHPAPDDGVAPALERLRGPPHRDRARHGRLGVLVPDRPQRASEHASVRDGLALGFAQPGASRVRNRDVPGVGRAVLARDARVAASRCARLRRCHVERARGGDAALANHRDLARLDHDVGVHRGGGELRLPGLRGASPRSRGVRTFCGLAPRRRARRGGAARSRRHTRQQSAGHARTPRWDHRRRARRALVRDRTLEDQVVTTSKGLSLQAVTLAYGEHVVTRELDLEIEPGRITALVGPNGSGKSTVLRALARILRPRSGTVLLDGEALSGLPTREVSRRLAMLPQTPSAPDGITVRQLVAFGRFPYRRWFGVPHPGDAEVVERVLRSLQLQPLAERALDTLSGGQAQRAWLGMALAQDTPYLLLDEPTAALDLAHRLEVMDEVQRLDREFGKTIVMVLHDLNLAARFADTLVMLESGRVVASGPPETVLTRENLRTAYGVETSVLRDDETGSLVCVPYLADQPSSASNSR